MDPSEQEDHGAGFLITCDKHKEKLAIKDAFNFLNEYIEQLYGDFENKLIHEQLQKQGKEINLKNEIEARGKIKVRILNSIDTHVNCLVFIKINPKFKIISPNAVTAAIMKDVHKDDRDLTRFCHKIMPVERSFKAEHFKMLDQIDEMFQARDNSEVKSWALNFRCRNNSKFNYKEILGETEKIAKKYGHFVDIYYPQWTVSIEIINHLMCLSIVENFKEYLEYRMHKKVANSHSLLAQSSTPKDKPAIKKQKQQRKEGKPHNRTKQQKQQAEQPEEQDEAQKSEEEVENGQKEGDRKALLDEKIQIDQEDDVDFI